MFLKLPLLENFSLKGKINEKINNFLKAPTKQWFEAKTTKKEEGWKEPKHAVLLEQWRTFFFFQILLPMILLCRSSLRENEENGQTTCALGVNGPRFKVPISTDPSTSGGFSHWHTQPTFLGPTRVGGKQVTAVCVLADAPVSDRGAANTHSTGESAGKLSESGSVFNLECCLGLTKTTSPPHLGLQWVTLRLDAGPLFPRRALMSYSSHQTSSDEPALT